MPRLGLAGTLDALLHANAHREEPARRYKLMRVPGYDLDPHPRGAVR